MSTLLHDVHNEEDAVRLPKMAAAITLIRNIKSDGPVENIFIRRGTKTDLFSISHALVYAVCLEALISGQHHPEEVEQLNKTDLNAWRKALIDAVLLLRCIPKFNQGVRQNHDWSYATRGGLVATQMAWRMLNTIGHREPGSPWPTPEEAMHTAVLDYVGTAMKYGRTYRDINDYTGKVWFANTPLQLALLYRIDPVLLCRCKEFPGTDNLKMVDTKFAKHLEFVFAIENDPTERIELFKKTWNFCDSKLIDNVTLPHDVLGNT